MTGALLIIPWEQYRELSEALGLDLDAQTVANLREARRDWESGHRDAFVPLSSTSALAEEEDPKRPTPRKQALPDGAGAVGSVFGNVSASNVSATNDFDRAMSLRLRHSLRSLCSFAAKIRPIWLRLRRPVISAVQIRKLMPFCLELSRGVPIVVILTAGGPAEGPLTFGVARWRAAEKHFGSEKAF